MANLMPICNEVFHVFFPFFEPLFSPLANQLQLKANIAYTPPVRPALTHDVLFGHFFLALLLLLLLFFVIFLSSRGLRGSAWAGIGFEFGLVEVCMHNACVNA